MSNKYQDPENVADLPTLKLPEDRETSRETSPDSAPQPAPKPKKVIGRPITKENAKQYQLSAAKAKKIRKQARAAMLNAMVTKLSLGDELVKAFRSNDEKRIAIVEKALRIVGLTHDQSSEAMAQRFEVKTDANINAKTDNTLHFIIEDAKKEVPDDGGTAT